MHLRQTLLLAIAALAAMALSACAPAPLVIATPLAFQPTASFQGDADLHGLIEKLAAQPVIESEYVG